MYLGRRKRRSSKANSSTLDERSSWTSGHLTPMDRGVPGSPNAHLRLAATHIHYGNAPDVQGNEQTIHERASAMVTHGPLRYEVRQIVQGSGAAGRGSWSPASCLTKLTRRSQTRNRLTKLTVIISGTALRSTGSTLAPLLNVDPLIEGAGLEIVR